MSNQKEIEEMANIPTKEEIEARNKIGKEKDELRQALLHYATAEATNGIKTLIDCEGCAFYLYEVLGYCKIDKDKVVISREEYQNDFSNQFNKGYEKGCKENAGKIWDNGVGYGKEIASKETAEKIYKLVDNKLDLYRNGVIGGTLYDSGYQTAISDIKRKIKDIFGVEIKEK